MSENNDNNYSITNSLKIISDAFGKLGTDLLKPYIEYSKNLLTAYGAVAHALGDLGKSLLNSFKDIKIPSLSEERKKQLLESFEQWGKYGWTIHPLAPLDYYDVCPDNHIEADKHALRICTKENTNTLFNMLREKEIPKKDLEEAIICFNNKCYKSCAMLLYSIIDGKVIRLQRYFGENTDNLKVCGEKGIIFLNDIVNQKTSIDKSVFFILSYSCLVNSLNVFFEKANNFTLKTNIANRNLVDHGMANNPVRRKDCLKLFLLLYNLLLVVAKLQKEK